MTRENTDSPSTVNETQQSPLGRSTIVSGPWGTGSASGAGAAAGGQLHAGGWRRRQLDRGGRRHGRAGRRRQIPHTEEQQQPGHGHTHQYEFEHRSGHPLLALKDIVLRRPIVVLRPLG